MTQKSNTSPRRRTGKLVGHNPTMLSNHGRTVMKAKTMKHAQTVKAGIYVPAYSLATYLHFDHLAHAVASGLWWSGALAALSLTIVTLFDGGSYMRANGTLVTAIGAAFILGGNLLNRTAESWTKFLGKE